jgi:hypothetical protein
MICIKQYPALNQILWDYNAEEISKKDAYYYYNERLKSWFDEAEVKPHEMNLINELTNTFGGGISLF